MSIRGLSIFAYRVPSVRFYVITLCPVLLRKANGCPLSDGFVATPVLARE
jgi:hypothetical protein